MAPALLPQDVITRKRDGFALSEAEISAFVQGACDGSWADYQLSALLMAIFLRGMTPEETVCLTRSMMHSGVIADLSRVARPKADKHSTGGVGDKVSLHLAPMVAACGVAVPMISGRGLGHTGGTLDKLESIPGFKVGLSLDGFARQVDRLGLALIGQTRELAPADRKLYSLRDVTGTVECIPLICASILSKKLAEGIDVLVLDVKCGRGAFMKDRSEARALAQALVSVACGLGKPTRAVLTAMDQPLGTSVGNALEVRESLDCLRGRGPKDTMEVTFALGEQMLLLAGTCGSVTEARAKLQRSIDSGEALARFRAMVEAQDGDPRVVDDPQLLPKAPVVRPVTSRTPGFVVAVDAMAVAYTALRLGAGRVRAEDGVDPAVGIDSLVKVGDRLDKGAVLGRVHARSAEAARAASEALLDAVEVADAPAAPAPLVYETVG